MRPLPISSRRTQATGELRLVIAAATLRAIYRQAEEGYPEEICGGLLGRTGAAGTVAAVTAVAVENRRIDERGRRYLIGPADVLQLERRAAASRLHLVGYYHSHPDAPALPSQFDRAHAWPGYTYLIVGVERGRRGAARAWRLSDDRHQFDELTVTGGVALEVQRS